jgi:hypothetical protein
MLKKIAPEHKIKRLLTGDVSLKRAALSFVDAVDFLDKKSVSRVALNTIKGYQERIARAQADKMESSAGDEIQSAILDDPKQLIQRVQNEVILQISSEIKTSYSGEQYEWLPSEAETPDPEHQLNYGKVFTIGDGEMPGERIGCLCGMNILVKETQLELG